jgi:hypothetical protein
MTGSQRIVQIHDHPLQPLLVKEGRFDLLDPWEEDIREERIQAGTSW